MMMKKKIKLLIIIAEEGGYSINYKFYKLRDTYTANFFDKEEIIYNYARGTIKIILEPYQKLKQKTADILQ